MRYPILLVLLAGTGCASSAGAGAAAPQLPAGVEAISLLGDTLRAPPLPEATRLVFEARLDSARRAVAARPDDPDALIWLGRRTAYLGRYREAIEIYSRGIARWPADARFYRHRGHRFITVRRFDLAVADLERAAALVRGTEDAVEPDGLPNARGIPTSTLHTNVFYHLGLAYYLRGDDARARQAWEECLAASRNRDMEVATRYWLYLTLLRAGDRRAAEAAVAPVQADWDIIENGSYHRLILLFRGLLPVDSVARQEGQDGATTQFGVGAWRTARDGTDWEHFDRARAAGAGQWAAFGYIAAEAALARRQAPR